MKPLTNERIEEVKEYIDEYNDASGGAEPCFVEAVHALTELLTLREQLRWRKYPEEKPKMFGWYECVTDNSGRWNQDFIYSADFDNKHVIYWKERTPPPIPDVTE